MDPVGAILHFVQKTLTLRILLVATAGESDVRLRKQWRAADSGTGIMDELAAIA
jgi:hypothetical protein